MQLPSTLLTGPWLFSNQTGFATGWLFLLWPQAVLLRCFCAFSLHLQSGPWSLGHLLATELRHQSDGIWSSILPVQDEDLGAGSMVVKSHQGYC